ncbi:EIF3A factor, partial [Atractosteus spatula]|nr:EIF3A factor [Atractosteus spatula]
EFLEVGKKQPALDVLYDVIKSKKHRTWQKIHEPIMLKYLELCVDLRKSHLAKEGLYQYKNICQQVNIKSLEDVVRAYLKLAEEKTETAKEESQQMVLDIEDLDNIQTPESVLLSAVSGEDTQDRTDRLLLTPWVKFLWESYRQCLDLLRNNSKVERLYHDIAQQAFKFCLQYTRKAEFRKLCDNLRMHLGQIQRHHNQSTAINLNNPESQSMHLETRLVQLDSAISMELWQEAFKAVEDIHGLFALSKKPPKPQLMANYYNKVSTVFWKSGNALFHACTLHRLYHLSREMRKNLTQEEMQRMSTRVLLATLSIPITPERTDIARLLDMDGIIVDKHRRLATLLGLQAPPTRQGLINDMVRFNLLQYVVPDVKDLYNWLEVDFHPLKLCGRVTKLLNWVRDQAEKEPDLQHYVPHLQNNTILRLLQQVAQIYQSIEFSRLASLVPFVDAFQLERSIVDAARHCDLQASKHHFHQVRIDHTSRTLSFGSDLNYSTKEDSPVGPFLQNMPSEQIRNQLTAMSSALAKAIDIVKPPSILQEREEQNQQAIAAYLKNARKEHQRILARRQTIEERKERLESLNIQREKEELEQREAELQKVRKAEEERLRQEAKEREKERIMQEHQEIKIKTLRERLEQIKKTELGAKAFKDIDIEDLEELDTDFIMAKQVEQLEKEKKELHERLKNQEKKIDYFERAKRLEEIPLIKKAYEEQRIKDMELWELQEEERINNMKVEREKALEHKQRMSRMMEDQEYFVSKITAARRSVYEEKLKQFQERLVEERKKRLEERKKQRKEDRRNTYYREKEEEAQRIHEEQLKKEREEQERIEREQREEEEREYQERLRKLEEQERKQRARQQEIEERERRKEEERRMPEEKGMKDSSQRWADKEEGGWRKRIEGGESDWRRPVPDRSDDDKPAFRRVDEDRGPKRGVDEDRGPKRGVDEDRGPKRGVDDDWGPKRGMDEDRGPRRGLDEDRGPRRGMDDDRGPRRGFDEDRGPRRGLDEDRGPRRGADEDWAPRRGGDDERGPRRGMDDDGPRRDDPKPWKPLGRPGMESISLTFRITSLGWGPPRDMAGCDDGDERDRDDRDDADSERFRDRRPPREESGWRRGGGEEQSWRDSTRRDDWDRGERDRRDDRDRRDLRERRDDRDRRGPPRGERGSWRRGGEEKRDERREERDVPRRAPPRERERDRDGDRGTWRSEKDKEVPRRTKNEIDDDGWTTVRR